MWKYLQGELTHFFIIVLCTVVITFGSQEDDLYIIRSKFSPGGLVLDGSNSSKVTIEFYTGFSPQLWRLPGGAQSGQFYIVNSYTEEAIDFDGIGSPLVTRKKTDSLNQQYTVDAAGHIINVANKHQIDIVDANFKAGNFVILWKDNGCTCQIFILERQMQ